MAIVESDSKSCAFESGSWSLPLSDEDLGLPLEANFLAVGGSGDGSCSDPLPDAHFQSGGDDFTVDAYLVLDQCSEALVPPPTPHPEGGELAAAEFCFSDSTTLDYSWLNEFAENHDLMDHLDLPTLSMFTLEDIRVQELDTTDHGDDAMDRLICIPDTAQGDELVEVFNALDFDRTQFGEYAEPSLGSMLELGGDDSLDNAMLNYYFPALPMSSVDEIQVRELGTPHLDNNAMDHGLCISDTAEAGEVFVDELDGQLVFSGSGDCVSSSNSTSKLNSGFQFGGDVSLDDAFFLQDLQALSMPSGEEIPVPGYSSTTNAMDIGQGLRIGDHHTACQGDVLGGACPDEFVSDGSGEYASSSDSMSVLDSWLQFGGVGDDDNVMNYQSVLAGRKWPVKEPSESIGVDERGNGTWEAHIWLKDFNIDRANKEKNGMQFFLGSFSNEEDAKRAHDKAAIMLNVRVNKYGTLYSLNYPEEQYADYIAEHADWSRRDYMWKMRRESGKFSKGACSLKGVARRKNYRKPGEEAAGATTYTATMSVTTTIDGVKRKTTMTIGHFESEDEAGREYDKSLLFIKGVNDSGCITNFRPGCYSASEVQDAGRRLASAYPRVNFTELSRKQSGVFAESL